MSIEDTTKVMAMRDQMNFDALSQTDAHLRKEFQATTDPLVSFGTLPEANKDVEEAKDADPVEQNIIEEATQEPV